MSLFPSKQANQQIKIKTNKNVLNMLRICLKAQEIRKDASQYEGKIFNGCISRISCPRVPLKDCYNI